MNIEKNFQEFTKFLGDNTFNANNIESVTLGSDEISFIPDTPLAIAVESGMEQFLIHSFVNNALPFKSLNFVCSTKGEILLEVDIIDSFYEGDSTKQERFIIDDNVNDDPHKKFIQIYEKTVRVLNDNLVTAFKSAVTNELNSMKNPCYDTNQPAVDNVEDVDWI